MDSELFHTRATLERAAHLLNTRTPRSFDFDKWARRIAQQLCDLAIKVQNDDGAEDDARGLLPEHHWYVTDPPSLREGDVTHLARASRDGGAEFLEKIIAECRRLVADRANLPDTIDPTKV